MFDYKTYHKGLAAVLGAVKPWQGLKVTLIERSFHRAGGSLRKFGALFGPIFHPITATRDSFMGAGDVLCSDHLIRGVGLRTYPQQHCVLK